MINSKMSIKIRTKDDETYENEQTGETRITVLKGDNAAVGIVMAAIVVSISSIVSHGVANFIVAVFA